MRIRNIELVINIESVITCNAFALDYREEKKVDSISPLFAPMMDPIGIPNLYNYQCLCQNDLIKKFDQSWARTF